MLPKGQTKLDGNNRWNSKMLLTEHQEQYEKRNERNPNRPSNEEFTIVRDFILLPHMLTMVEEALDKMKRERGYMCRLYTAAAFALHDSIGQDHKHLRTELRQRNIKVVQDEQKDFVSYYQVFCRGYQERFGITRDVMRSKIKKKMTAYIEELERRLKVDEGKSK